MAERNRFQKAFDALRGREIGSKATATYNQTYGADLSVYGYNTSAGRSEEHTLNSSHITISYAVFCLKKKKKNNQKQKKKQNKTKHGHYHQNNLVAI